MGRKKAAPPPPIPSAPGPAARPRRGWLPIALLALALTGGALFALRRSPASPAAVRRDSLLLITLDTTRADHLGAYGYAAARTPNLDRLASQGARFERASTCVPITLPSHASIFTGLYPPGHGVRNNGRRLPDAPATLAGVLRGHGYKTAGFVSAFVLDRRWGLDRGFETYDDAMAMGEPGSIDAERRGDLTAAALVRWLEAPRAEPFFAWLHLYDPHDPYRPPPPFDTQFAASPYDGEIALADQAVGAVLDALDRRGLTGRTLVAVVGDHGEGLGEHGEDTHGVFVYETDLRVPLILWGPGRIDPGRVVREAVSTIDLAPTLLSLLGAPPIEKIEGRSLVPLLEGTARGPAPALYAESQLPQEFMDWAPLRAIRDQRFKFIEAPRPELYDLQNDAQEKDNLFAREPRRVEAMRAVLARHGETPPPPGTRPDAESAEKLAALGYVGAAWAAGAPAGTSGADPKDKIALFNRLHHANLAIRERRLDDAVRELQEILRDSPGMTEALLRLGKVHFLLGRFKEARDYLQRTLPVMSKSATVHHQIAMCSLRLGDTPAALREMDAALAIDPKHADTRTVKGAMLAMRRDFAGAVRELRIAVEADPRRSAPRLSLARALTALGQTKEADAEYEAALAIDPDDPDLLTGAGMRAAQQGNLPRAEELLRRAVAVRPLDGAAQFELALVLERMGRRAEAAFAYRRLAADQRLPPPLRNASQQRLTRLEPAGGGREVDRRP